MPVLPYDTEAESEETDAMSPEGTAITRQVFWLCAYGSTLIFIMVMVALLCGHDGIAVSAGAASIAGLVAGAGGFTIAKVLK